MKTKVRLLALESKSLHNFPQIQFTQDSYIREGKVGRNSSALRRLVHTQLSTHTTQFNLLCIKEGSQSEDICGLNKWQYLQKACAFRTSPKSKATAILLET
jgi:hypothetical protein